MIGYHYTSYKNWLKIKKQGLKVYPIKDWWLLKNLIEADFPTKGIYVWKKKQNPKEHLGVMLDQLMDKNETKIVCLSVDYTDEDKLKTLWGQGVDIFHDGDIENFHYHTKARGTLLGRKISPERIKLLGVYDFEKVEKLKI